MEYDPNDYQKLLQPFYKTDAQIVYGSRFMGGDYVRLHYYWHFIANKLLTAMTNIFTNLNMTDMETGYKVFKSEVIKSINLKENSFGIEPEITVKLAKKKFKFYEVAVSYKGRSYAEGKKITLKEWRVLIFQILSALAVIQNKYPGFRHNDLKANNLLVNEIGTTHNNSKFQYKITSIINISG